MLNSAEFYDQLAPFYDLMNDWSDRLAYEGPFIKHTLLQHGAVTVLDAACGAGHHTLLLKKWGYEPTGADASPQMIARAQANAAAHHVTVPFIVACFQDLTAVFDTPFDAVLCLGNSLPHITDEADLDASLDNMAQVLRPGGLLLLHNLNYDQRWVKRPRFLKLDAGQLAGRETLVWRLADYGESTITFHTALFQKDEEGKWTVQVNSTPQKPLFRADLEQRLQRLGFREIRAFGNLHGDPFVLESSGDLVLVATKQ